MISVSAFAHPEWMMRRFLNRLHLPDRLITLVIRYVERVIGYRYEDIAPINTVCHIHCPILLVHGKVDRTVPVEDALTIKRGCGRPHIRLLMVENADQYTFLPTVADSFSSQTAPSTLRIK